MDYSKYQNNLPWENRRKNEAAFHAYNAETIRLTNLFKADLFEEYGVADNPKADDAFNLAWQHGHSAGYSEVANYFDDFVRLIL